MLSLRSRALGPIALAFALAFSCASSLHPATARASHGLPHFSGPFFSQQAAFGFDKPIGMAIAPDGRMFFVDDAGIVKTKAAGIGGKAAPLFDLSDHVNLKQDRGLISVAVDKNYATNRHIYLAYTFEDRTPAEIAANSSLSDRPKTQRLVRVTVPLELPAADKPIKLEPEDSDGDSKNDEHVVLGSYSSDPTRPGVPFSATQACPQPADLVNGDWSIANQTDCLPSDSHEHTIDSVRVDPVDGTLWVSVGDGGSGGSTLDPRAWRSQRIESYSGKLLHVNTNGSGLAGHPFCPLESNLTRICTKVHAKGFRNPFRFFLRPAPDGRPVVADAGWNTREELDLVEPGKNYGWPCREGKIPTPTWSARPECTSTPVGEFSDPIYDYPQITGGAVIGGITYSGKSGSDSSIEYPAEYKDAIFFSDYGNLRVWYLKLNAGGTAVAPGYPKVFADDVMAVDWATAPNGELMYVDIGFGPSGLAQVRQISFDPSNAPPQAVAKADKTFGPLDLKVAFDGSASSDPDGDKISYAWDLDDDGDIDSTSPTPQWTYKAPVNVTVTLRVDDGKGQQDTDTIELYPGNQPPVPSFATGPTIYRNGEQVAFTASVTDPDESLGPKALSWNVKLDHAGTHIHPLTEKKEASSIQFTTDIVHDAPSTYIVELTATDSRGMKVTKSRILNPVTRVVRIESSPQGAPIIYGGTSQIAPFEKPSTIGLVTTVSAGTSFAQGGNLFEFDRWSDGGPAIRDLTVPDQDVTLVALYRGQAAGQPPAGGGSQPGPGGDPIDLEAARLSFDPKRGLVNRRKSLLRGSVEDESGVRRVQVALRAFGKQRGRCRWWSAGRGGFSRRATGCARPAYMQARLSGGGTRVRWTLPLSGLLEPGRYLLVFRTVDKAGNVGRGPGGRPAVQLRVPAKSSGR